MGIMQEKKMRTTIRLPQRVRLELQQRVVSAGYGLRGKSRWVAEAIEQLLELPDYPDYVDIAEEMSDLTATEVIQLPIELKARLDHALIEVRTHYPTLEGVQSCLVRSAIMQRLLRGV